MTFAADQFIGKQLGDFIIREQIGQGGMALVFRAHQPSVHRDVALKIIPLDDASRQTFQRRFTQEAELIASLEHIHILPVYDYGVTDLAAYLAMRLLRGGTLADRLNEGPLHVDEAARLFRQFASGLNYAHQKGVIHRDLKPSNIMLDDAGNVMQTDFGLAKLIGSTKELTRQGTIVGTPSYMSPEQLRGETLDNRSDIYSAGIVLYHMLTGREPFGGPASDLVTTIYQQLEKTPDPLSQFNPAIVPDVELIVLRALRKKPDDRYHTIQDMAEDLDSALGYRTSTDELIAVRLRDSEQVQASKSAAAIRHRRYLLLAGIAAALVVIALAIVAVLALVGGDDGPDRSPTVLAGEVAQASQSLPTTDEIERAQARLGSEGFIGYIACTLETDYHATQAREVGDFAAQYGLGYRIYDSDTDDYKQLTQIEQARAEGAAGLIICPLKPERLDTALTSVQEASIPLVLMHSDMPSYGGVLLAGDDYMMGLKAGRFAGQIVAEEMDGQAAVIVLDYPDLPIIVVRADGLEDGLHEFAPDAHVIGRYLGGTPELGQTSVEQLLADGVRFDVILSINDAGAFGAIEAMEEAGIAPDSVIISSVDAEVVAREYMRDGYFMRGSVAIDRVGFSRTAVNAMVKLLAGSTLPETYVVPPGEMVTRETVEESD
jgi:ABC-type sugar transport system substrate-binding protein